MSNLSLTGVYFVTGTDTEIGKTTTTANLVKTIAEQGKTVYAIKPVTAGPEIDENGKNYSEDAQRINQFSSFGAVKPPTTALAPICLTTPASPHIAADIDGVTLDTAQIVEAITTTLHQYPADVVLIEGAGGWFTPINDSETLADVAVTLNFPVIVVVGIKLGSLNHAMLTLQAIWQANLKVAMVVFNQLAENIAFLDEQISWLQHNIARQASNYQNEPPIFFTQSFFI